jgi:hypothetical protein
MTSQIGYLRREFLLSQLSDGNWKRLSQIVKDWLAKNGQIIDQVANERYYAYDRMYLVARRLAGWHQIYDKEQLARGGNATKEIFNKKLERIEWRNIDRTIWIRKLKYSP